MADPVVESVISNFADMVASVGDRIEIISLNGGVLKVLHEVGVNDECPECVLSSQQIEELLVDTLKIKAPYVARVEVKTQPKNVS